MTEPRRGDTAAGLYNELLALDDAEQQAVARIVRRLRALRRARPSDSGAGVALLAALAKSGRAGEALRLADELWARCGAMPPEVRTAYAATLVDVGRPSRALRAVWQGPPRPETVEAAGFGLAAQALLAVGDLATLQALTAASYVPDGVRRAVDGLVEAMRARARAGHLPACWEIVHAVLAGFQVRSSVCIRADEGGPYLLARLSTVGEEEVRQSLARRLDERLADYAARHDPGREFPSDCLVVELRDFRTGAVTPPAAVALPSAA